jgi:hypothetical protein
LARAKRVTRKTEKRDTATPVPVAPTRRRRWPVVVAVASAFLLFLAIYLLRIDRVVGLVVDDAWYLLLAKALATGHGYTLINSPTPDIRPFYSPGFPALLAVFYRLWPRFPENIYLLKAVSIAAMTGVGIASYIYFTRYRELPNQLAFGIAVATVLYPALVFLATSTLMSECVFMLVQLLAIIAVERSVRWPGADGNPAKGLAFWSAVLTGGLLASFALLIRPAGAGLLVASVAYMLKQRLWRTAVVFAATCALLVGPWLLYSRAHSPNTEQRNEQGGNIVQSYAVQFWQRTAGQPLNGTITLDEVPERIWKNVSEIGKNDIGALAFYSIFRPLEPGEPIRLSSAARFISWILALLALTGFVTVARERLTLAELVVPLSLLVTALWGWEQFRLILPLVPFLLFYLLMGMRLLIRLLQGLNSESDQSGQWGPLTVLVGAIIALNVYSNVRYIQKKHDPVVADRLQWTSVYDENEALIKYVGESLPKGAVIATQNPALLNLYTGQKTVASDDPEGAWDTWNRVGVRYLVRTSPSRLPKPDAAESKFRVLYHAPGRLNLRVVDLGPPGVRERWANAAPARPLFQ